MIPHCRSCSPLLWHSSPSMPTPTQPLGLCQVMDSWLFSDRYTPSCGHFNGASFGNPGNRVNPVDLRVPCLQIQMHKGQDQGLSKWLVQVVCPNRRQMSLGIERKLPCIVTWMWTSLFIQAGPSTTFHGARWNKYAENILKPIEAGPCMTLAPLWSTYRPIVHVFLLRAGSSFLSIRIDLAEYMKMCCGGNEGKQAVTFMKGRPNLHIFGRLAYVRWFPGFKAFNPV